MLNQIASEEDLTTFNYMIFAGRRTTKGKFDGTAVPVPPV
jgi:hypothetical protein